jgi:glycosyltransferase involved in cell wall biosynthesis
LLPEDNKSVSERVPLVSTVIPTFNRRNIVRRAIDSALAQTCRDQEIIVIDDGSTDGTREELQEHYGDLVRCVSQANGGVSSARNHGMRLARGDFIALLDSDDEWESSKLEKQLSYLDSHPDFGMVLTDVRRVDTKRQTIDIFRRRDIIPEDGDVLFYVLRNPALAPASAMFRKVVFDRVGGFDESLRTAEDIDFHLRVASAFKIGVIAESLTVATRGGEGLSSEANSDSDYVHVLRRFVQAERARIPRAVRSATYFATYARTARSSYLSGRITLGMKYTVCALTFMRSWDNCSELGKVILVGVRVLAVRCLRALRVLVVSKD